jgi:hypothetical protein
VQTDALVFDDAERSPQNPTQRLRMEALNHLDSNEQNAVAPRIEGAPPCHQAPAARPRPARRELHPRRHATLVELPELAT